MAELKAKVMGKSSGTTIDSHIQLEQNSPYPFTKFTTFHYSLPAGIPKADLLISDYSGKMIKSISISSNESVTIDASSLSSGAYNYSIIVEGKVDETKKMIVT